MMRKMKNKIIIFTIIALILFLIIKFPVLQEGILLIFISFLIAYVSKPLFIKLNEMKVNKRISALLIILFFVVFFATFLIILIPPLIREEASFESTLKNIKYFMSQHYGKYKFLSNKAFKNTINLAYCKITSKVQFVFSDMLNNIMNSGGKLLSIAVIPIIVYYFLVDGEKIENNILMLFPVNTRIIAKKILKDIDKTLNRYIISQFILSIIMTIFTFIILAFLKVNFPLLLAIINGIFNIIPYFGPILGAIPAIVAALLISPKTALLATILICILQQIEGNIISPKVTGDSVDMHPLWVILLVIMGEKLMGFWGMLLAIPIGVIIKIIYDDITYYMY